MASFEQFESQRVRIVDRSVEILSISREKWEIIAVVPEINAVRLRDAYAEVNSKVKGQYVHGIVTIAATLKTYDSSHRVNCYKSSKYGNIYMSVESEVPDIEVVAQFGDSSGFYSFSLPDGEVALVLDRIMKSSTSTIGLFNFLVASGGEQPYIWEGCQWAVQSVVLNGERPCVARWKAQ